MKFVKFLPQFGWNPVVLTVLDGKFTINDPSLLSQVPATVTVIRTRNIVIWLFSILAKYKAVFPPGSVAVSDKKTLAMAAQSATLKKLKRLIKEFFIIPDGHIFWMPLAVLKGVRLIRNLRIPLIYATGDPFSNHVVGALLKLLTGKPLLLDFRDAWIADPAVRRTRFRRFIESRLEAVCVRLADKVVSVTAGVTDDFRARYEHCCPATKFITIPNGYDLADGAGWETYGVPGQDWVSDVKTTIVHTGRLMGERTPKFFLQGLALARDAGLSSEDIEVIFVGDNIRFNDGKDIQDYILDYRLHDFVRILGFLPRQRSIWYMFKADVLLLLIGIVAKDKVNLYGLAGKVYDYMLARKPIIVLGDLGGPAQQLFERTKIGKMFESNDVAGIKNYLLETSALRKSGSLSIERWEHLEDYDLQNLSKNMASEFDMLAPRTSN